MDAPPNNVLARMLERLLASMLSGPNLNCRPHSSRQRIDFAHLDRFADLASVDVLRALMETDVPVRLTPRVTKPPAENGAAKKSSKQFGASDPSAATSASADDAK